MRIGLLLFLAAAVSSAGAVGWLVLNNSGEPPARLLLEADLSEVPDGTTPDDAIRRIEGILETRAFNFGARGTQVSKEDGSRLSVTLEKINMDGARKLLLGTGLLEVRQPVLDGDGNITCRNADGTTFLAPPANIEHPPVASSVTRLPVCLDDSGQQGEIVWESATASGDPGTAPALDSTFLTQGGASVLAGDRPVLTVQLNSDGATLLNQVTSRLLNLPLGVFIDDELIFGPTVTEPIIDGRLSIYGLSLYDVRILAAKINAGPLPAPIREIPP